MSMEAYTFGLIGLMGLSILIFKLRLAVVSFIWGILCLGVAGVALQEGANIAFHPYMQICLGLLGVILALYGVHLYRGGG